MNWRKYYQTVQILSLDVAFGALASGMMVVVFVPQAMPLIWYFLLPTSVWVIYTADHLLDAWRLQDQAHTPRHLFHFRHFRWIFPIWLLGLIFCLLVAPFLIPRALVYFGLAMGGLVLIHLGLIQLIGDRISRFLHKELGVGLIYAAGIWGGPMVLAQDAVPPYVWTCALQFLLLALINLLVFSIYEMHIDEQDGHTSFVRAIGRPQAQSWIVGLSVGIAGLALIGSFFSPCFPYWATQGVYLQMMGLLLWISRDPRRFAHGEAYRLWGDAAFLFPIFYQFYEL